MWQVGVSVCEATHDSRWSEARERGSRMNPIIRVCPLIVSLGLQNEFWQDLRRAMTKGEVNDSYRTNPAGDFECFGDMAK